MKPITSRDNPLYKELKRIASSSQAQRKAGRTLLDGVHLCDAYLQHVGFPQICVVCDSAATQPEIGVILEKCRVASVSCVSLPEVLYQPISQVENGVGILFLIDVPHLLPPALLTQDAVLLDRVQDPGNFGSILRSAAAAGIRQVYCATGTALAWSPRVLRAGMGAHFLLQIFENADLRQSVASSTVSVLATSPRAQQTIYDADLRQPVAWLFGHEGQGVSDDLLAQANLKLAIPQPGAMESLNVAACAAVCLFEQVRQRR
ncbi:MAG: RNA methyltransferase [Burkholderiaceae bacterium]|nr:RNA methyltransferase [Burkholderiaceae bacterium]